MFHPFVFLLSPCVTEQWLAYHWWYAYYSLGNPALYTFLSRKLCHLFTSSCLLYLTFHLISLSSFSPFEFVSLPYSSVHDCILLLVGSRKKAVTLTSLCPVQLRGVLWKQSQFLRAIEFRSACLLEREMGDVGMKLYQLLRV
jgi:hypothetical protein